MKTYKVKNEKGQMFDVDEDKISDAEKDGFLPVVSNGKAEHRVNFSNLEKALADGFKPLGNQSVDSDTQTALDSWQSLKEGLPGAGLANKAASATVAGMSQIKDLFSDRPDKSFSEHYQDQIAADAKERSERNKRTPIGTMVGDVAGAFVAPNPASIAGRVGLNVADQATRADSFDELKNRVSTAAIGSTIAESIPVVGKYFKKSLAKPAQAAIEPAAEVAEEAVESGLKKIAGDSITVPEVATAGRRALSSLPDEALEPVLKKAEPATAISEKVKEYLISKAKPAARKSLGVLTSSDDEMLQRYLANKDLTNAARPIDEIAADTIGNVDKLRDRVVQGSRDAAELISDDIAVHNTQLIDKLNELKKPLSESYTDTGQAAKSEINRIIGRLSKEVKTPEIPKGEFMEVDLNSMMFKKPEGRNPTLSGQKLKKFVKNLDQEIDYADRAGEIMTPANQAKVEFRKYLDSILKEASPEYKEAMTKVAKDAETLTVARKMFGKQDATASRLKSAANRPGDKREVREALAGLDAQSGTALQKENDARKVKEYFQEDLSGGRGPRNRIIGSAIGGAVGGIFGPIGVAPGMYAGMKAGQYLDSNGRKIAKSAMDLATSPKTQDFLSKMESKIPRMPANLQRTLQSAAQRGGNALAVTHYLLGNQDPEYQSYFNNEEDEQ